MHNAAGHVAITLLGFPTPPIYQLARRLAQQIGEQAGLFVCGGTNEEAKQFIDGLVMKNPNFSNVAGNSSVCASARFCLRGLSLVPEGTPLYMGKR